MSYHNWTKQQIADTGQRIKQLIQQAQREMMNHSDLLTISDYISTISKANEVLKLLRKEYLKR